MGKKKKKIQTQYTTDGRDLSHQGTQLARQSMSNISDYQNRIQNRIDPYMKYIDLATAAPNSDFLTDYKRATAQQTGSNYAATHGGYSSANQLGYDDLQKYYNDYAARLYTSGLGMAEQMAQNEYSNYLAGAQTGSGMYGYGKEYSDIEQYNNLAKQNSWLSNLLGAAGDTIGSISMKSGNPLVMGIGGAVGGLMGTAGRMTGYDEDASFDSTRGYGSGATAGQYSGGGLLSSTGNVGLSKILSNYDWFNKNPLANKGGN